MFLLRILFFCFYIVAFFRFNQNPAKVSYIIRSFKPESIILSAGISETLAGVISLTNKQNKLKGSYSDKHGHSKEPTFFVNGAFCKPVCG